MAATETVTLLFTDLVGSTELAAGLDPDEADVLRQLHFGHLRRAIAEADGTEVKNLGDGLMVVFPGPSAAVACAMAMQQAIDFHNQASDTLLSVRVGISTGEAASEDGDYFGDPVVEAARLCAAAEGGQILVADIVKIMTSRRFDVFEPVGNLDLKGFVEPIEAWSVRWERRLRVTSLPVPSTLAHRVTSFVGRSAELETLSVAHDKACADGEHQLVLLAGEAGMGKTTLVGELARLVQRRGGTVLYGQCDEDLAIPYDPFVEVIGQYIAQAPEEWLLEHEPQDLGELVPLVPKLGRRLPALPPPCITDPDTEQYLLFAAVAAFLATAAAQTPLVVVLDDLHWADRPTLQLLRYLSDAPLGRVLIVGTYRDNELASSGPLTRAIALLRTRGDVEELTLSGLTKAEVREYVEITAGHALDRDDVDWVSALHRDTNGNPFFVSELLRHLIETGAVTPGRDGQWETAQIDNAGLPRGLREIVGARTKRLGSEACSILATAAVVGQEFELDLLARVARVDEDRVLDILEEAVRATLVTEVSGRAGRFRFAHALIQQALLADLSRSREVRLHMRVGEVLEEACGAEPGDRVGELAQHWLAASDIGGTDKALHYSRQAGTRALALRAPDEAVRWFTHALELLGRGSGPDPRQRASILAALGEAQRQTGEPSFRNTLLDAAAGAQRSGDATLLVAAALANHRGFASASGVVDPERLSVLEAALNAAGPAPSSERAQLLALLASELTYADDSDRRFSIAEQAIAIARQTTDPTALLRVLNSTYHPLWVASGLNDRLARTAEAVALSEGTDDPAATFWAYYWGSFAALESGDLLVCEQRLERSTEIADETRQPMLRWVSAFARSWRALLGGDVASAEQLAVDALQLGTDSGQLDAAAVFGAQLLGLRWHEGRLDEILSTLAAVADDNPGIPAFRAAHALCLVETGETDEAARLLGAALDSAFAHPDNLLWLTSTVLWSEVAGHLEHAPAAAVLARNLAPFTGQVSSEGVTVHGAVDHYLGLLNAVMGDVEAADGYFARALVTNERLRAPFFVARTKLQWAHMLLTADGCGENKGNALRHEAEVLARRHGCRFVERRASELTGGRP